MEEKENNCSCAECLFTQHNQMGDARVASSLILGANYAPNSPANNPRKEQGLLQIDEIPGVKEEISYTDSESNKDAAIEFEDKPTLAGVLTNWKLPTDNEEDLRPQGFENPKVKTGAVSWAQGII